MKNFQRIAALVSLIAGFIFVSSVEANANPFTLVHGQSVTVNYATTFSGSHATATFTYNQTTNQLTVVLTNTSTDANKLFSFGFDAPGVTQVGSPSIAYGLGTSASFVNGAQSLQHSFGVNASTGNNGSVLNQGESLTAVFTFTSGPPILNIDITRIHIGSLPGSPDSQKPNGTTNPVPEPASMILLGGGLIGLAAGIRRRRMNNSR